MDTLTTILQDNLQALKRRLPAEDILSYAFASKDEVTCAIVYTDGIVNKGQLGDLIVRPLSSLLLKNDKKEGGQGRIYANFDKNDGGRDEVNVERLEKSLLFPEVKRAKNLDRLHKGW